MCCIWQCMACTVLQSRCHIPVYAVYGSVWHIQSPRAGPTSLYLLYIAVYGIYSPLEQAPHPCICCIWQCMAYKVLQSRAHIPVCAVYGSVWHIQSPRGGPISLYMLYMAMYGIYIPPEQALHPCMCCIWQCMGYTFPQSRPYIPVCAVDGSVWDIHSPRAGPTSLYVLYMAVYGIYIPPEQALHPCMGCIWQYMAYTVPQSRDHIPVSAVYGSVWHIQSPRAGPTSLYLLYMAVYGIYSPLEHAPHPCMCCIWQCMADRVPRSRPDIPVCAVYGSVWHIQSSRGGPTSLYVLYMAVYGI